MTNEEICAKMDKLVKEISQRPWANEAGLSVIPWGEQHRGITIKEENRATVYETTEPKVNELMRYMRTQYWNKGVKAVLTGVQLECESLRRSVGYAVFVQDGFLMDIGAV